MTLYDPAMTVGSDFRDPGAVLSRFARWALLALVASVAFLAGPRASLADPASKPAPSQPKFIPAGRIAENVFVIPLDGPIDRITAQSVIRRIGEAESRGADAIVIHLHTPGGEVGAVLDITNALKTCPVRTVAWIDHQAYSGGALVALACNEIVTNDPASLGDAKPIAVTLGGARPIPPEMLKKILPPLIGDIVDSAQRKNRREGTNVYDELLVQGIVLDDARLWWIEDTKTGVRYAITQEEFRRLFPGEPEDGPGVLAGAGSAGSGGIPSAPRPGHGTPAGSPGAPDPSSAPGPDASPSGDATPAEATPVDPSAPSVVPASPAVERIREDVTMALSGPSLRPVFRSKDAARYKLLYKVSDAHGPLVFESAWMAYFNLAENTDPSGNLQPIRSQADLQSYLFAKQITTLPESWSEKLVRLLTTPALRGLLIFVFLVAIFIEMTHPGLVLPGALGAVALIALLAPPILIGMAQWWEIAAIIAGLALIALEVLVIPGFGIPGILGLLLLFVGLVATFVPGGGRVPDPDSSSRILTGLTTVVLSIATAVGGMFLVAKYIGTIPILQKLILKNPDELDPTEEDPLLAMDPSHGLPRPGDFGRAATVLRPSGRAQIGDRFYDVVAEFGYIPEGTPVKIVSVTEFRIGVEVDKRPETAAAPGEPEAPA
jgi:membrane-bound ClpP family serine protease